MSKQRSKTLPDILKADRNAGTVYLVIRCLSNGSRRLSTTRGRISEVCGLSPRRIGAAINTLHSAGWVVRNYGYREGQSWYRLTLPQFDPLHVCLKTTHMKSKRTHVHVCPKTTHMKPKPMSKNDTHETITCVSENDTPLPKGKVGGHPSPKVEGAPPPDTTSMRTVAGHELEAQKLRRIRQHRELEYTS